MDTVETFQVGSLTVKLYRDEDAGEDGPRDWDNLGTMVCFHRNYRLGDKNHKFSDPAELTEYLATPEIALALPLYLLDHSGITMRCGTDGARQFAAFDSAGWDWGKVGYIFVTRERLREEYSVKRITKTVLAKAEQVLRQEVATYDQLLTGDVWYYVVESEDGDHLDSCGGLYGFEYAKAEATSAAKSLQAGVEQAEKMERETFAL